MLEVKIIELNDLEGKTYKFELKQLSVFHAIKLGVFIARLSIKYNSVHGAITNELISRALKIDSGQQLSAEQEELYKARISEGNVAILSSIVTDLLNSMDDNSVEEFLNKCLQNVIFHNGMIPVKLLDAIHNEMFTDHALIIDIVKEVLALNFVKSLQYLKKYLTL